MLEEDLFAGTGEDASIRKIIDEIVLLVDMEDPDAPSWTEALESSDRDKWLEGAQAELTSLHEMGRDFSKTTSPTAHLKSLRIILLSP